MFGWLKKRVRKEHLKLLRQNQLAAEYLYELNRTAAVSGIGGDEALMQTLDGTIEDCERLLLVMHKTDSLSSQDSDNHLKANKALRRLYDQVLFGRKQFARQFGSASEPLASFDQKFTPNEGWTNFFAHIDRGKG